METVYNSHLKVNFDIELQKMSNDRLYFGGGNRRRRRGENNKPLNRPSVFLQPHDLESDWDQDRRQQEVYETPEQKLRTAIIKLGEVVSRHDSFFQLGRAQVTYGLGCCRGASSCRKTNS